MSRKGLTFSLHDSAGRLRWRAPIVYTDHREARRAARTAHACYVFSNDERVRVRFRRIERSGQARAVA